MVMPGWVKPKLRPDHVDDPLRRVADPVDRDAELRAVVVELADLRGGHLVDDRQPAVRGGDRVIGGGHGLARAPHARARAPGARRRPAGW